MHFTTMPDTINLIIKAPIPIDSNVGVKTERICAMVAIALGIKTDEVEAILTPTFQFPSAPSADDDFELPEPKPSTKRGAKAQGSGPVFEIRQQAQNGKPMSQADFAKTTGVSRRSIQRAEACGGWPESEAHQRLISLFAKRHNIDYSTLIM